MTLSSDAPVVVAGAGRAAHLDQALGDNHLGGSRAVSVEAFLARHAGWTLASSRRYGPLEGGDGFFSALLSRA